VRKRLFPPSDASFFLSLGGETAEECLETGTPARHTLFCQVCVCVYVARRRALLTVFSPAFVYARDVCAPAAQRERPVEFLIGRPRMIWPMAAQSFLCAMWGNFIVEQKFLLQTAVSNEWAFWRNFAEPSQEE
jgi:hypothetical protein